MNRNAQLRKSALTSTILVFYEICKMKFSIGDKVLLKRTKEEGKVIAILDKEMVEVEVLNTHFPVFTDELEHPYLEWFTSKKMNAKKRALTLDDFPAEKPEPRTEKSKGDIDPGFYLAFLPVYHFDGKEEHIARLKIYLINETEYQLKLYYSCYLGNENTFSFGTNLLPYQHLYLHYIKYDDLNDKIELNIKLEQQQQKEKLGDLETQIKLKPKTVYQNLKAIEENNQPLFRLKIAEDFQEANLVDWTKDAFFSLPKANTIRTFKTLKKQESEIDLHIENLVDQFQGISNAEKLNIQLAACEDAIHKAVQFRQASLIVIHGIGSGKLKEEVHKLLKGLKEVKHFENKYSSRFGFGATEVFLKY